LWKTLQTFGITRIVIATLLFGYLWMNAGKGLWAVGPEVMQQTCAFYLFASVLFASVSTYCRRHFTLQLLLQVLFDVAIISAFYFAAGGARSGLAILYLFPLAGGAILAPLGISLFLVSLVALILLFESGYHALTSVSATSSLQAGLYGGAFFIIVLAINRLARRLLNQEYLATERGNNLHIQEEINRLIIADMDDGIVVAGHDGKVFALNPSAERMLGLSDRPGRTGYRLSDVAHLAPIERALQQRLRDEDNPNVRSEPTDFVMIKFPDDSTLDGITVGGTRRELGKHLKLRFATIETRGLVEDRTLIFLQDVSDIENRAQQLKLASMGRLTASIAHEVRNPLSAISHAATLLEEDVEHPASRRLISIVIDNVARLNRMIEDILGLSRKAQRHGDPFALVPAIDSAVSSVLHVQPDRKHVFSVTGSPDHEVRFDPLHFHEVLINLLSNALRYASQSPGSIRIQVVGNPAGRLELHVQDDGPAISSEVRSHLFEPFYTTSSKGTGLGLYMARELCMSNGAMLDYEYRLDGLTSLPDNVTGRFVITFDMFDLP
jgi:two-component system sensor histidine kinase PilS (NtrC family)